MALIWLYFFFNLLIVDGYVYPGQLLATSNATESFRELGIDTLPAAPICGFVAATNVNPYILTGNAVPKVRL